MILSRVWYVLLGVAAAVALYVVYLAVGRYNRQTTLDLKEGLASDSQTVEWALKIDARHRLDALLVGSLDKNLRQAIAAADVAREGRLSDKPRTDARRALSSISDAIPAGWRADVLFAVNRAGEVVAVLGYDSLATNEDFELGGYPAVNDALHGWLRDDLWVWGSKMYQVVARPVENVDYDPTQPPSGAIVGLKEVGSRFAEDLAKRTRTNLVFYAGGRRTAAGIGIAGFDPERLDAVGNDLKNIDDKTYRDGGRSDVRMLSDDLGTVYTRLPGDAWVLGAGFAAVRGRTNLASPMSLLTSADDFDKSNVPWGLLVVVVIIAAAVGVGFTVLEHSAPLNELVTQAEHLKRGGMTALEVVRFRGPYRLAAQGINDGIERAIEKAGGVTRKPADLDAILGPAPAQPAMSAFAFPGDAQPPKPGGPGSSPAVAPPSVPGATPARSSPRAGPLAAVPTLAAAPAPSTPAVSPPGLPPTPPIKPFLAALDATDDDATMVGEIPADVMAQATGSAQAREDPSEWSTVYEDFVRTKKQCGEPVDGVTFEKFAAKLRQNRDALLKRHGCKRVRFSVYVKDGRASLKATPIRDS